MRIPPPVDVLKVWIESHLRTGKSPQEVAALLRKRLGTMPEGTTDEVAKERYREAEEVIAQMEQEQL